MRTTLDRVVLTEPEVDVFNEPAPVPVVVSSQLQHLDAVASLKTERLPIHRPRRQRPFAVRVRRADACVLGQRFVALPGELTSAVVTLAAWPAAIACDEPVADRP